MARSSQQNARKLKGKGGNKRRGARPADDALILEGRHALEEALAANAPIEGVFVLKSLVDDPRIAKLVNRAKAAGAQIVPVGKEELDRASSHGAHQGVAARLRPYRYVGVNALIKRAKGAENALVIACDHVTDAGNFGAIVRTAEVVGAAGVLIPNKRSAQVNTAAFKTSAGAVMHCLIAREANLVRSLEQLKEEGFWVVGASEHASDVLWDAPLSGRVVLVMGSEDMGLSQLVRQTCDVLVKLPQAGKVESLNVAQATTAIAYEWMRQCNAAKS